MWQPSSTPDWPSDQDILPDDLPLFRQPASRHIPGPFTLDPVRNHPSSPSSPTLGGPYEPSRQYDIAPRHHNTFSFGGPTASCWMNGALFDNEMISTDRLINRQHQNGPLCQCSMRAPRVTLRYDNINGCAPVVCQFPGSDGLRQVILTPIHLLFRLLASASQSCAAKTDPRRWENRR